MGKQAGEAAGVVRAAPPVKAADPEPPTKVADNTQRTEAQTPAKASCESNSFAPDTPVLMGDGTSTRSIAEIAVGEEVFAADPLTGEDGPRQVVAAIGYGEAKPVVEITVRLDEGRDAGKAEPDAVDTDRAVDSDTGKLLATTGHPIWVEDERAWIDAGDLEPGDRLRTDDGALARVEAIRFVGERSDVRNLTVAGIHTYYVMAGETPVLVHNCGGPYDGVREASQMLQDAGVPRQFRKQVIDSFEAGTIKIETAGDSAFGMRFYDGVNAQGKGRYLTQDFGANREQLALLGRWNQMTHIAQFQIRPGTRMITGRVAGQGPGYPGGATQMYIMNLDDLL